MKKKKIFFPIISHSEGLAKNKHIYFNELNCIYFRALFTLLLLYHLSLWTLNKYNFIHWKSIDFDIITSNSMYKMAFSISCFRFSTNKYGHET